MASIDTPRQDGSYESSLSFLGKTNPKGKSIASDSCEGNIMWSLLTHGSLSLPSTTKVIDQYFVRPQSGLCLPLVC